MLGDLSEAAGLSARARRHPLLAIAAATAGGALAGRALIRGLRSAAKVLSSPWAQRAVSRGGWDALLARELRSLGRR